MKLTNVLSALCILAAIALAGMHYAIHYKLGTAPAPTTMEAVIMATLFCGGLWLADNSKAESLFVKIIHEWKGHRGGDGT